MLDTEGKSMYICRWAVYVWRRESPNEDEGEEVFRKNEARNEKRVRSGE